MKIIIFDTETSGLPKSKLISPDTLNLWPNIVQFSYLIYDTDLNIITDIFDNIVKMEEGFDINEDSTKIHGITNIISKEKGINITTIIENFFKNLINIDLIVGHNISFDINMLKVEILRLIYNKNNTILNEDLKSLKYNLHFITNFKNIYCTMKESLELCGVKILDKSGKEYLKFPKLIELHEKLFECIPNNLHNSLNDILVTLRCFLKLKYNIDLNETCLQFKDLTQKQIYC